jgi:nucleotide-binding universal stress UspA family protein
MRLWPRRSAQPRAGAPRLLVPFVGRHLDPTVLDAALRIARAEDAVLVPAYLLVVPLEFSLEAPIQHAELQHAMPILEAVELAARRAGVPVDARMERGRTPTDVLRRLWSEEWFDRIVVPAPAPGHPGFTAKELAWMLTHAPSEILVLRPGPGAEHAAAERPDAAQAHAEGLSASPCP